MAEIAPNIDLEIVDADEGTRVDPETGVAEIPTPTGGVVVDFNDHRPQQDDDGADADFNGENLALKLSADEQSRIVDELIEQIESDDKSRHEWLSKHAEALQWLGCNLESPKAGDIGTASAPAEGMSTYIDPVLLDAVVRAKSTASAELLPASGPVKVKQTGRETTQADLEAEDLERDLNHWLTDVATEYYPDTKRMLFWSSFAGCGFKKGYHCPIRRRPVIESVKAQHVIVSADATDFQTATRITHRSEVRKSTMLRLMALKHYVQHDLPPPAPAPKDRVTEQEERITGQRKGEERMEDRSYPTYETYAEINIDSLAPTEFKGTGIMLPWVVTVDIENRRMLSLRRDWDQDDEIALRRMSWVKYPYIEALGFYGLGLMHLIGNTTIAISAAAREGLDAGMLANFPAFLLAKWAARQDNLNIKIGPTEATVIDTGDRSIGDAIQGLPYKDVTAGLMAMMDKLSAKAEKLAGSAELPTGEGRADVPVGTIVAQIEQATKVESDVHKGLHTAQAQEFRILVRLFREDPEAFVRHRRDMARQWDEATFMRALENYNLEPVADPNTPSHIHRLLKVWVVKQAQQGAPALYNARAVEAWMLRQMRITDNPDELLAPPQAPAPPPPDPKLITALANKQNADTREAQAQTQQQKVSQEGSIRLTELGAEQQIENTRLAREKVIHDDTHALAVGQAVHDASMDIAGQQTDFAQAHAAHGLAVSEHHLDRSKHALDLHQAVHDAAIDVHGPNQPEPEPTP